MRVYISESANNDNHELHGVYSTLIRAQTELLKVAKNYLTVGNVSHKKYLFRTLTVTEWNVDYGETNSWFLEYDDETSNYVWERDEKRRHKCVSCGKLFNEEDITFAPDPFNLEINGDDTPVWKCQACRQQSVDDIYNTEQEKK